MKYVCDVCGYVYDPEIGDPDNEMAKDEARHGAGFRGLLNRYFK